MQTQFNAVTEELGELARMSCAATIRAPQISTLPELALEAADLVIAAVCLFGYAAGVDAAEVLIAKLGQTKSAAGCTRA